MTTRNEKLSRLTIASPCEAPWDEMQGDGRRRHCLECDRQVHDLGQRTPRQIAALVEANGGHLCARITRDAQGRIVTQEPGLPVATSAHGIRRASPMAAAVVSCLLGLGAAGPASAPAAAAATAASRPLGTPDPGAKRENAPAPGGPGAGLRGRIADTATGAPLPGVEVVARNTFDSQEHSAVTDGDGRYELDGLAAGVYELEARAEGFAIAPRADLLLHPGERQEIALAARARPEPGEGMALGGVVMMQEEPLRRVFEESELVVLATAGSSVRVDQDEDYGEVATEFRVDSTFKGHAPGRGVRVYHAEVGSEVGRFAPGTRVLAFLRARDEETGRKAVYESADYHFGLKVLSADELEAYGERLEALAPLLRHGEPAGLGEWLVATAEEPLTRHEATAELRGALAALQELARRRGTTPEQTAEDLRTIAARFVDGGGRFENEPAPALLAAFLTDEQKERLSLAFQATPRLTQGDLDLYAIIRPWAGDAALSWLADKLRQMEPEAGGLGRQILRLLTEELEDEELKGLLAAADREIEEYGASLDEETAEEAERLVDRKTQAVEKELRRRFVQALGGKVSGRL